VPPTFTWPQLDDSSTARQTPPTFTCCVIFYTYFNQTSPSMPPEGADVDVYIFRTTPEEVDAVVTAPSTFFIYWLWVSPTMPRSMFARRADTVSHVLAVGSNVSVAGLGAVERDGVTPSMLSIATTYFLQEVSVRFVNNVSHVYLRSKRTDTGWVCGCHGSP